jgi:hypothetical protein
MFRCSLGTATYFSAACTPAGPSGDIVVMNQPNWYLLAKPNTYASTHGSPWSYGTNVPLAMYGPNWIKPGKYGDSEVVDLARTIAFILNVRPRAAARGACCRRR